MGFQISNRCRIQIPTIELECLGISYALRKTDYYLRGQNNVTVLTDHKPLVGIFNKPLQEVENPWLLRLREKLSAYIFQVEWMTGKHNLMANALSRAPYFPLDEEDKSVTMVNTAAVRIHHIAKTQHETYKTLVKCTEKEKPPKEKLDMFKAVFP